MDRHQRSKTKIRDKQMHGVQGCYKKPSILALGLRSVELTENSYLRNSDSAPCEVRKKQKSKVKSVHNSKKKGYLRWNPAGNYMSKVNNSVVLVFFVNFEHISQIIIVFLLLTGKCQVIEQVNVDWEHPLKTCLKWTVRAYLDNKTETPLTTTCYANVFHVSLRPWIIESKLQYKNGSQPRCLLKSHLYANNLQLNDLFLQNWFNRIFKRFYSKFLTGKNLILTFFKSLCYRSSPGVLKLFRKI